MTALENVLAKLDGARQNRDGWMARCPGHDDGDPSLSVRERTEGDPGAVVHCFAGCSVDEITAAIGMTTADLFDEKRTATAPRIVETYDYTDADGDVIYRVARFDPKDFRPQTTDDNGKTWRTGYNGRSRVLYRLPEVVAAVTDGRPVYVVEGEKDADALAAVGVCATTSPGGAQAWRHVAAHARQVLASAVVIVVPDKDGPGRKYAVDVVSSLRDVVGALAVAEAAIGKDAAEHLGAGKTVDELVMVAAKASGKRRDGAVSIDEWLGTAREAAPIDTATGEVAAPHLGEEFWTALPVLDHIRTAARSRRAAPTAVLGSVLARVAALTPPSTCVPPFVGGTVPLNIIVALVGSTSTGKSINERVATELLPNMPPGVAGPFALGSGEGAAEAFIERYTATDDNGRKVQKQRQTNYGVLFTLDEGRVLTELGSRSGSTLVPTLCTMWTGGDPGRMNASTETRRTLPVGGYSFGLVSLWQPTRMAGLFDDTDGGLPGRFLFLGVNDPDVPDIAPEWPGPIEWTPPAWIAAEGVTRPTPLEYPADAAAEVDANRLAKLRGETVPPLDGHRDLGRLKIAGALAVIDGQRHEVGAIHWKLAGDLLNASDRLRAEVLAELDYERRRAEDSGNAKAGRREVAKVTAVEAKAMDAAVRAIGRKAHREAPNVLPRRELTQAIKGTDRKITGTEAPIEEAERLGYIAPADGGWIAGESRPAA